MSTYYRDPEFHDFWWVNTTEQDMTSRGVRFYYAGLGEGQKFLVYKFIPALEDRKHSIAPNWVSAYRPNWINYMSSMQVPKTPELIKPNPALPIIRRLSGCSEEKVREILVLLGAN